MTEDEILNEIYDQMECTFSIECNKCCMLFEVAASLQKDAADHFFAEGFTFRKFKPDEIGGEIICGKCR